MYFSEILKLYLSVLGLNWYVYSKAYLYKYGLLNTLKWLVFGSTTEYVSFIYLHVQVYSNKSALSCNILE